VHSTEFAQGREIPAAGNKADTGAGKFGISGNGDMDVLARMYRNTLGARSPVDQNIAPIDEGPATPYA
jgi:hypothetical protein